MAALDVQMETHGPMGRMRKFWHPHDAGPYLPEVLVQCKPCGPIPVWQEGTVGALLGGE